jgi:VanZ family protein
MRALATWLPPVAWMLLIGWFSTSDWSAQNTAWLLSLIDRWLGAVPGGASLGGLHAALRKAAHVVVYAVLAALWYRALARRPTLTPPAAAWIAFAISLAWATLDEAHQATLASRTGTPVDVLIDGLGAGLVLTVLATGWRRAAAVATTLLLWLAAAGGALAIALNLLAGVPSGPLWLTAPAALLLLVARRRPLASPAGLDATTARSSPNGARPEGARPHDPTRHSQPQALSNPRTHPPAPPDHPA